MFRSQCSGYSTIRRYLHQTVCKCGCAGIDKVELCLRDDGSSPQLRDQQSRSHDHNEVVADDEITVLLDAVDISPDRTLRLQRLPRNSWSGFEASRSRESRSSLQMLPRDSRAGFETDDLLEPVLSPQMSEMVSWSGFHASPTDSPSPTLVTLGYSDQGTVSPLTQSKDLSEASPCHQATSRESLQKVTFLDLGPAKKNLPSVRRSPSRRGTESMIPRPTRRRERRSSTETIIPPQLTSRETGPPSGRFQRAASTQAEGGLFTAAVLRQLTEEEQDRGNDRNMNRDIQRWGANSWRLTCSRTEASTQTQSWAFDQIFDVDHTNVEIFELVKPRIEAALAGYDEAIIADGQSGAGKTFTLLSGPNAVLVHIVKMLFAAQHESKTEGQVQIKYQIIEHHSEGLRNHVLGRGAVQSSGLVEYQPHGFAGLELYQIIDHLAKANLDRLTESTNLNPQMSSRGHLFFVFSIQRDSETSQLVVADLAGSEKRASNVDTKVTDFINRSRYDIQTAIRHAPGYRRKARPDAMVSLDLYHLAHAKTSTGPFGTSFNT